MTVDERRIHFACWAARIAIALVFIINISCAFEFLAFPSRFLGAYELEGIPGVVALQGLAVAFLMWNVTYPVAIAHPIKYRVVFTIVLIQQAIGLIGESFIFFSLPQGHELLLQSIGRFIVFDGAGLVLMGAAFIVLFFATHASKPQDSSHP